MLIYGRAALLGLSGGVTSCTSSYLKCPKNEYEILYYLNNHRGGFFKFFSEPNDEAILQQQQQIQQQQQQQQVDNNQNTASGGAGESSLLGIFSAITGIDAFTQTITTTTTTQRPPPPSPPRPATTSLDSVGNFFTKILSEYLNGVEYQRRRRKRSPITNENTVKDIKPDITESNDEQEINLKSLQEEKEKEQELENEKLENEHNVKSRILHKELHTYDAQTFFPQEISAEHVKLSKNHENRYGRLLKTKSYNNQKSTKKIKDIFKKFNAHSAQSKLKFPTEGQEKKETSKSESSVEYEEDEQEGDDMNIEKQVIFLDDYEAEPSAVPQKNQNEGFVNFLYDDGFHVPNGQKVVFNENSGDDKYNNNYGDQQTHDTQINTYKLKEREHRNFVFPDQQYDKYHIRKGRILNRPTYASHYSDYHEDKNQQEFVLPGNKRRPHSDRAISTTNVNSLNINQNSNSAYQNLHFSNTIQSNSNSYANSYATTPTRIMTNRPTTNKYYSSSNSNSNYNRYGQEQSTPHLTTKPPTRHKDDENIYVTNARGETEYYLTPGGRKVYLRNN